MSYQLNRANEHPITKSRFVVIRYTIFETLILFDFVKVSPFGTLIAKNDNKKGIQYCSIRTTVIFGLGQEKFCLWPIDDV